MNDEEAAGCFHCADDAGAVHERGACRKYALLEDGTAEIIKYVGKEANVVIPDTLDGKKITVIGEAAFSWCTSLTSITFPDSVTSIGERLFVFCPRDLVVTVPRGSYAEQYCRDSKIYYAYPD